MGIFKGVSVERERTVDDDVGTRVAKVDTCAGIRCTYTFLSLQNEEFFAHTVQLLNITVQHFRSIIIFLQENWRAGHLLCHW